MICGFDYGTSNCALGLFQGTGIKLVPLEGRHAFLPSTLYALDRDLITEFVGKNMVVGDSRQAFTSSRQHALIRAQRVRQEEDIDDNDQTLFFWLSGF